MAKSMDWRCSRVSIKWKVRIENDFDDTIVELSNALPVDHQEGNDDEEAANIMELVEIVDEQMNNYDENKDGMITYAEFVKNHKKLQANDDGL